MNIIDLIIERLKKIRTPKWEPVPLHIEEPPLDYLNEEGEKDEESEDKKESVIIIDL